MTGLTALLLGLGLGLRHAIDADHVVVVSALVEREQGVARAAQIALLWGVGHAASLLTVGVLFVLAGVRAPPAVETATELLVALMLLGVGGLHTVRSLRPRSSRQEAAGNSPPSMARPLLIGMVHGLAGSAGIALLAVTTMQSRFWALAYLLLFGIGSVSGMFLLTVAVSSALGWTRHLRSFAGRWIRIVPGVLSVLLGLMLLSEVLRSADA